MAKSYPDTSIHDDWNDRLPPAVTSLADDVAKADNEPDPVKRSAEELLDLVETSAGAVPSGDPKAEAARAVGMKDPETIGRAAVAGGNSGTTEPGDSGATEPEATKSVKRVATAKATDS